MHAQNTSKLLTSADGSKIYADASGDPNKQCILFIHGFGLSGAVFDRIFEDGRYTSEFYLVRYDMRGHGRSDKPGTITGYTSFLYAQDFKVVVEAFNVHKPVVVGWSLGGTVSADIASHLPHDTTAGFVYLNGLPYTGNILNTVVTPLALNLLKRLTAEVGLASMVEFIDDLFLDPTKVPWELRTFWLGMVATQNVDDRVLVFNRIQDPRGLQELGKKGLPLLVLAGSEDKLVNRDGTIAVVKPFFPNLEVAVVRQGGSHACFIDNMEETMENIIGFTTRITK